MEALMAPIKSLVQRAFRGVGLEVRRAGATPSPEAAVVATLAHLDVDLVLDVGANVGQFAMAIRRAGYRRRIVSFEPLPDAHEALLQASSMDPLWDVFERCALGDGEGEVLIHVAGNSVSSSARPMLPAHWEAAPDSRYVGAVRAKAVRLDDVFDRLRRPNERVFLKVDAQGCEGEVLDGAAGCLDQIAAVHVELSLVPLYEGQQLWDALVERLGRLGFGLWSLSPGFSDARTGRTLQCDAVFARPVDVQRRTRDSAA